MNSASNRFSSLLVFLCVSSVQAQLAIRPPQPAAGSVVTIEGMTACYGVGSGYSLELPSDTSSDAVIKIFDRGIVLPPPLSCPPSKRNRVVVGPLESGMYRVEHYIVGHPGGPPHLNETKSFAVTGKRNVSFPSDWVGIWWDPANPGWGVTIDRHPASGHVFAAWYLHETIPGGGTRPIWLVSSNMSIEGAAELPDIARTLNTKLTGDLARGFSNRAFFDNPSSPYSLERVDVIGKIEIEFLTSTEARLTWQITTSNLFGTDIQAPTAAVPRTGTARLVRVDY
ncbi:MAG: hypothetical protein JNJ55_07260 [Betaproteobacteria bacterium]|nr:hypothetical protein [Betaproteobacteria bacterium]